MPSTKGADGVIQLGWFDLSAAGQAFLHEMYELGWVHAFDWPTWMGTEEGRRLSSDPGAIASASADDLGRLLTAILRGERFSDGQIEGAFKSGILPAIARRAAALVEEREQRGS